MAKVLPLYSLSATYSPERLTVLRNAFDRAWQEIAGNFGLGSPAAIDSARTTLANVILSLPCSEIDDADRIKETAIRVMAARYRNVELGFTRTPTAQTWRLPSKKNILQPRQ
jgi:hypothetical protein